MELSVVFSRAMMGFDAPLVRVETHLSNGLPAFHIVGMPETAVRESKDRVRSALLNSHFSFPDRRITVSLAPADLPKEGGRFDLPIALGILSASGQLPADRLAEHEFLGELALDGSLREVPGSICAALAATESKRKLVLAHSAASVTANTPGSQVLGSPDLLTLCAHLNGSRPLQPTPPAPPGNGPAMPDLGDVVGQAGARRALEIAAAGGHHLLFTGPPGTGKTLLASRLPGILPPPSADEVLTSLALANMRGATPLGQAVTLQRPFRSPHHSASAAALAGGGSRPQPGEISLAHGGVLFLDELPEFNRSCLEALREPLEAGQITLPRANSTYTYPASFQLVAAMNPCPCGFLGDAQQACRCSPTQVQRYRNKISGPLLDRIDLHVQVDRLPPAQLLDPAQDNESSAEVQARVSATRQRQVQRQGCSNNRLSPDRLFQLAGLEASEKRTLEQAATRLHLSGRALHRTLRVALTIADLAGLERVTTDHVSEALAYRRW